MLFHSAKLATSVRAVVRLARSSYFASSQPLAEQVRLAVGRTSFNLDVNQRLQVSAVLSS